MVWVPEFGAEERDVPFGMRTFPDERATHYWDGQEVLTTGFSPVLGLPRLSYKVLPAWDVFMIFGPQAIWTGKEPPKPDFWMHQLNSAGMRAPRLRPAIFARRAEGFLPPCLAVSGAPESEPSGKGAEPAYLQC